MEDISSTRHLEGVIAELAERQHGVFGAWQFPGVDRRAWHRRVERRLLRVAHHGVYATGHAILSRDGRYMAAVLAGGPGAVLCHRPAANHHAVLRWNGIPEVMVPGYRARPGILFHRCRLHPDEMTVVEGIPVTTAARTVIDIAPELNREQLEGVLGEIERRRLYDRRGVQDLIERHKGRRGLALLRTCTADDDVLRSNLERQFRRLVREERLDRTERPQWNATIALDGDFLEVDCLWPKARVVVELDSRKHHMSAAAFERDRQRDRRLLAAAFQPFRVTARMMRTERVDLVKDLKSAVPGARPRR
jgi:very-short-patch-repair endonuclease